MPDAQIIGILTTAHTSLHASLQSLQNDAWHEEINESKVAMEAQLLMGLLVQINKLMGRMHQAYINYMSEHLKVE